jgi:hypothetical protein
VRQDGPECLSVWVCGEPGVTGWRDMICPDPARTNLCINRPMETLKHSFDKASEVPLPLLRQWHGLLLSYLSYVLLRKALAMRTRPTSHLEHRLSSFHTCKLSVLFTRPLTRLLFGHPVVNLGDESRNLKFSSRCSCWLWLSRIEVHVAVHVSE